MTRELRIIAAGPCWETVDVFTKKTVLRSPTKRDLVYRTMEVAKKEEKCKVVIFHENGAVEEERVVENNNDKKLKDFLSGYYANLEPMYKEAVL
jgi:hypothetical protein